MNMIERVARALDPDLWRVMDGGSHLPSSKCLSLLHARTAIEAMREPTAEMKAAVREAGGVQALAYANAAWPTMIDAALKEPTN